jgi:hydroxymethylglutaryl-CoA lyase
MVQQPIRLVECPRDAMQGWKQMISTEKKVAYINALLQVGFDTIDFGSFVSPKAIPQMADTKQVLAGLDLTGSKSKLLAIIANERGAEDAVVYDEISYLGFPLSVSETFQQRNTNSSIAESLKRVEAIQELCIKHSKQLVVYLSMGFGNPYGDPWSEEIVFEQAVKLSRLGVGIISLADTVGVAGAEQVNRVTGYLLKELNNIEIGVHLHSTNRNWKEKLEAAYSVGCRRFDSALLGIGGCPMADDELVGNMDTLKILGYFEGKEALQLNAEALKQSLHLATEIFNG